MAKRQKHTKKVQNERDASSPTQFVTPKLNGYLTGILTIFAAHIPLEDRANCFLHDGTDPAHRFPEVGTEEEQQLFLREFVSQRLDLIARYEYEQWMNGKMPFVAMRDVQIWRLHQCCRFIWKWNIPDADHIASVFNLTRRKASTLINDFVARFRKQYLYPLIIRNVFKLLREYYDYNIAPETGPLGLEGRWIYLREPRQREELRAILKEPSVASKLPDRAAVYSSPEREHEVFVQESVMKILLEDTAIEQALYEMYPNPDEESKN